MDRQEREAELRTLLNTPNGHEQVVAILKQYEGPGGGDVLHSGTQVVDSILNYEYSAAGAPRSTSGKEESGDVKFEEPPAQESAGG